MSTLGIKVIKFDSIALCISTIRGVNPESIGNIKSAILSGDYVYTCDELDDEGLSNIVKLYEELKSLENEVELYEDDEPTTIELLYNLQESYAETGHSIDAENELESEEPIGIVITSNKDIPFIHSIVSKYIDISAEALKGIIEAEDVILECEPGDFDTLDKLIKCFEELRIADCSPSLNYLDEGATQKLYEMLIEIANQ